MTGPISLNTLPAGAQALAAQNSTAPPADETDMGHQFEQMLWAQMLSNIGLEKALTMNGGEAAASFSQYVIEEIASDLATTHPLGLADQIGLYGVLTPDTEIDGASQ